MFGSLFWVWVFGLACWVLVLDFSFGVLISVFGLFLIPVQSLLLFFVFSVSVSD